MHSKKHRSSGLNVRWLFAVLCIGLVVLLGYLWLDKPAPTVVEERPLRRPLDSVSRAVPEEIAQTTTTLEESTLATGSATPAVVDTAAQVRRPLVENLIRIQLLNGTKTKGLARTASLALRQMGFDVREVGNAGHFGYTKSQVIDRAGIEKNAKQVADSLGVSADNVLSATESRLVDIDVTFVIGADYKTLRVFR